MKPSTKTIIATIVATIFAVAALFWPALTRVVREGVADGIEQAEAKDAAETGETGKDTQ